MKKVILVLAIILVFGGFVIFRKLESSGSDDAVPLSTSSRTSTTVATNVRYKDGVYTGSVADATYGNIQVKVTIQGGKITDITYLQFPDKAGHTTEVSDFALPVLKQEAIAVQSANVDNVSGATQTTDGFKITLQSALDQAKIS